MKKVNVAEKFRGIVEYCKPRVVAELNGQQVRLTRMNGPFVWHHHPDEDELFFVVAGHVTIETTAANHDLFAGELLVVPKGVEHRPVAHGEVLLMLFEPAATRNTGNVVNHLTSTPDLLVD